MKNPSPDLKEDIERERRALDRLLLPIEVRQRVRLSQPTIDRMRRKGKFPEPLIIGERRIAWKASVSESWLAERDHAGSRAA